MHNMRRARLFLGRGTDGGAGSTSFRAKNEPLDSVRTDTSHFRPLLNSLSELRQYYSPMCVCGGGGGGVELMVFIAADNQRAWSLSYPQLDFPKHTTPEIPQALLTERGESRGGSVGINLNCSQRATCLLKTGFPPSVTTEMPTK